MSWGGGASSSSMEARQAANSGIATRDLPVQYTLPPDLMAAWQASPCRPGVSLLGADLRPELMVNNVRAAIFPHLQQQVQSSIALSMSRQAWGDIEQMERVHEWKCGNRKPRLVAVQAVQEEGHEARRVPATPTPQQQQQPPATPSSAVASTSASAAAPPPPAAVPLPSVSLTETFLGRLWSGHLWSASASSNPKFASGTATQPDPYYAEASATAAASSPAIAAAAAAQQQGFVVSSEPAPVRFLSSERWLVERCDGHQLYRVQYYGNGDAFYAQVVPTNISGLAANAWRVVKEAVAP